MNFGYQNPLWRSILGKIILLGAIGRIKDFLRISDNNQVDQKAQSATLHFSKIADFGEFPFGLREPHPLWRLFLCRIILLCVRCHLNYFWGLSGINQVGQKAQSTTLGFWKIADFGEFPSGLREPHPLWRLFLCRIILSGVRCHLNYFWS